MANNNWLHNSKNDAEVLQSSVGDKGPTEVESTHIKVRISYKNVCTFYCLLKKYFVYQHVLVVI